MRKPIRRWFSKPIKRWYSKTNDHPRINNHAARPISSVSLALHTRDVPRHVSPLPSACAFARQNVVPIDSRARASLRQCRQQQQAHTHPIDTSTRASRGHAPIVPQLIRVNDPEAAALLCHNVAVSVCKLNQEEVGPRREACEGQEAAVAAVACSGAAHKIAVQVQQHMRRVSRVRRCRRQQVHAPSADRRRCLRWTQQRLGPR